MPLPIQQPIASFNITVNGTIITPSHRELKNAITAAKATPRYWIYIFMFGADMLYVGESTNGILRLQSGLKRPHSHSLHYHWRNQVAISGKTITAIPYELDPAFYMHRVNRRTLEAELAFTLRKESANDRWPIYQGGIETNESLRHDPQILSDLDFIISKLTKSKLLPW